MSFIKNISVGGLMFLSTSDLHLEKDKVLQLRIKFPDLAPDSLEVEAVICSIKAYPNSRICEVRAKFTNLSEGQKTQLSIVEKMIDSKESKEYY